MKPPLTQILVAAGITLLGSMPSLAQTLPAPLSQVVYATGQSVPNAELPGGVPTDATFLNFGVPAINEQGSLAFAANWSSEEGRGSAIISNGTLVVSSNDPVPGIGGAVFESFRDPVSADDGSIAFLATIGGAGVTKLNNSVLIWVTGGGVASVAAREGDPAPGTGGAIFSALDRISLKSDELVYMASLQVGTGAPAVNSSNDVGLWSNLSGIGTGLRAREGDVVNGRKIRRFRALEIVEGSPGQGRSHLGYDLLNVLAIYTNGTVGVLAPNSGGIDEWARTPYRVTALGRAIVRTVGPASAFSLTSDFAVAATLRRVRPGTASAILAGSGTGQVVVARAGQVAPGAGTARLRSFKDPLYNGTQVAFPARLRGSGVTRANDDVLYAGTRSAPILVAREGVQAPELPAGAVFETFTSLAIPAIYDGPASPGAVVPPARGTLFTANLRIGSGGVTSSNSRGAWAVDSEGLTRCLFREGDIIAEKVLKRFHFLQAVSGSPGVTRAYNENYLATWRAEFADGSSALMKTTIPTPAETP